MNKDTGVYIGYKKFYRTFNGGKTMNYVTDLPGNEVKFQLFHKNEFLYASSLSGLYLSNDLGVTWKNLSSFYFKDIQFISTSLGYGLQYSKTSDTYNIWKSSDSGNTWNSYRIGVTKTDLQWVGEDTVYAFGYQDPDAKTNYGFWRSFNGGSTWVKAGNGLPAMTGNPYPDVEYFFFPNIHRGYAFVWNSTLLQNDFWRTDDGGNSWTLMKSDFPCYVNRMNVVGDDVLILFNNVQNKQTCIMKSNNGGVGFEELKAPGLQEISVYPNPAMDVINISYSGTIPLKATVEMLDMQDKCIQSQTMSGYESEPNISLLKQGVYFIKVISEKGVWVRKVVKE